MLRRTFRCLSTKLPQVDNNISIYDCEKCNNLSTCFKCGRIIDCGCHKTNELYRDCEKIGCKNRVSNVMELFFMDREWILFGIKKE